MCLSNGKTSLAVAFHLKYELVVGDFIIFIKHCLEQRVQKSEQKATKEKWDWVVKQTDLWWCLLKTELSRKSISQTFFSFLLHLSRSLRLSMSFFSIFHGSKRRERETWCRRLSKWGFTHESLRTKSKKTELFQTSKFMNEGDKCFVMLFCVHVLIQPAVLLSLLRSSTFRFMFFCCVFPL